MKTVSLKDIADRTGVSRTRWATEQSGRVCIAVSRSHRNEEQRWRVHNDWCKFAGRADALRTEV
jgi:hypothetical protein